MIMLLPSLRRRFHLLPFSCLLSLVSIWVPACHAAAPGHLPWHTDFPLTLPPNASPDKPTDQVAEDPLIATPATVPATSPASHAHKKGASPCDTEGCPGELAPLTLPAPHPGHTHSAEHIPSWETLSDDERLAQEFFACAQPDTPFTASDTRPDRHHPPASPPYPGALMLLANKSLPDILTDKRLALVWWTRAQSPPYDFAQAAQATALHHRHRSGLITVSQWVILHDLHRTISHHPHDAPNVPFQQSTLIKELRLDALRLHPTLRGALDDHGSLTQLLTAAYTAMQGHQSALPRLPRLAQALAPLMQQGQDMPADLRNALNTICLLGDRQFELPLVRQCAACFFVVERYAALPVADPVPPMKTRGRAKGQREQSTDQ